jgi:hypothetical protein
VTVPHSEVDFTLEPAEGGAPLLNAKVHTHLDPAKATVTFPRAGEYVLRAEGDSLQPSASLFVDGAAPVSSSSVLRLTVAEGPGLPAAPAPLVQTSTEAPAPARTPGLEAFVVVAALGAVALLAQRRR